MGMRQPGVQSFGVPVNATEKRTISSANWILYKRSSCWIVLHDGNLMRREVRQAALQ
jgi:hypothetical protein